MIKNIAVICISFILSLMICGFEKHVDNSILYNELISTLSDIKDNNNKNINVDESQYIILSYWASYDATSRIISYDIQRLTTKYPNIPIIRVSLDQYKSAYNMAIKQDYCDSICNVYDKDYDFILSSMFDINKPVNILLSRDSYILSFDFEVSHIDVLLSYLNDYTDPLNNIQNCQYKAF